MKLPVPPGTVPVETRGYLTGLVKALSMTFRHTVRSNEAVGSILLASPNGSVYTVRVTDAGVLETELIHDGT